LIGSFSTQINTFLYLSIIVLSIHSPTPIMAPHAIVNDGNVVVVPTEKTSKPQDDTHVLHRSLKEKPHTVVAADGLYLTLSNGQKILDASSGAAVSCLGHNHPRIKEALNKQQDIVHYCATLFYSTQAAEDLGDELVRGTEGKMAKCFIVSSGMSMKFLLESYKLILSQDRKQSKQP
jgi:adenosylmethionine-8-amino-7-oxononanoate aminotransferase